MIRAFAFLAIAACGGDLIVEPTTLDFGELDFNQTIPDAGYEATQIQISHGLDRDIPVEIYRLDNDRLSLGAQLTESDPPTVNALAGVLSVITIGVIGYEPGEVDSTVSGSISVYSPDLNDTVDVEWSYIPTRESN